MTDENDQPLVADSTEYSLLGALETYRCQCGTVWQAYYDSGIPPDICRNTDCERSCLSDEHKAALAEDARLEAKALRAANRIKYKPFFKPCATCGEIYNGNIRTTSCKKCRMLANRERYTATQRRNRGVAARQNLAVRVVCVACNGWMPDVPPGALQGRPTAHCSDLCRQYARSMKRGHKRKLERLGVIPPEDMIAALALIKEADRAQRRQYSKTITRDRSAYQAAYYQKRKKQRLINQ